VKKENIGLIKLLEEVVNEVGDLKNITSFDYKLREGGGTFYFKFKHQKCKCTVDFTQTPTDINKSFTLPPVVDHTNKDIIAIGYSIEGTDEQYLKTNYSLLLRILKTVVDIVKDSLHKHPEDSIFFMMAASKIGTGYEDPQKMNLYKLILQQNIPPGYRMGDGTFIGKKLIFLTKK